MRARAITYGKYLLIAVLGMIVFLFLWVQTGIGLSSIVSRIASKQVGEATVDIGSLRGNLFRSLTAKDIHIIHPANSNLTALDQLYIEFSIFKLLGGTVHLNEVVLNAIELHLQQDSTGTWDITDLVPAQQNSEEINNPSSFTITVDQFSINQLNLSAASYNPDRDSVYYIQRAAIGLSGLEVGESIALDLHTLTGALRIPDRADSVQINIQASLLDNVLSVKELKLASEQSSVFGSGTLGLDWQDSLMTDTDLALRANPLAFDDIRIFVPGLAPGHTADFMLAIEGNEQHLDITHTLDVSDGATLRTEAVFTQLPEQNYELVLDGTVGQLNPNTFDVTGLPTGNINLELSTRLAGSAFENMSGYSQAVMLGSTIASSPIDSTYLTIQWTEGAADLSLNTGLDEVDVSLSGIVFPFATPITYNVSGALQRLDIAPFTDSTQTSTLNVNLRIAGEGISPDQAKIDTYLDFEPSRINQVGINSGTLRANLSDYRIQGDAAFNTTEGSLSAQTLFDIEDDLLFETLRLELDGFNVNSFLNNPTSSSITGTLIADALLSDDPRANWVIQLKPTHYGDYEIESSTIEGSLEDGTVRMATETMIHSGRVELNAELHPFEDQITYEITQGSLSNLSLGPILRNDNFQTNLNGSFSLKGLGVDPASMQTTGALNLTSSEINSQSLTEADISFSLIDNVLQSTLDVLMPASEIRVDLTVDSVITYPQLTLEQGDVKNLNLGPILGDTTLDSSINGSVALKASGNSLENLSLDAAIDILPSTFNRALIKESQVTLFYRNNRGHLDANFNIDDGTIAIKADTVTLGDNPEYAFQVEVDSLNIANLTNQDSLQSMLNVAVTARGYGKEPQTMYASGSVQSTHSTYGDAYLENADLGFVLRDGLLNINRLNLISNMLNVQGEGDVALFDDSESIASDFKASGTLVDLSPLGSIIGAEALDASSGEFELALAGPPGVLQFDTRLDVLGILYNDIRIGVIDARVAGNLDEQRRPSSVTLSGTADQFNIPGFAMDEVIYSAIYADSTVRFNLDNQIDAERNAQLSGLVSLYSDSQFVRLNTVNLKLDEDQWTLQHPTKVTLGTPIVVDDFQIAVGEELSPSSQFVKLDGVLDVEGSQDVELIINELQIGTLASLFGSRGLDGTLNLEANLQGNAQAPQLDGELNLDIVSFGEEAGTLSVGVLYDSLRLSLDAVMQHIEGDSLTIKGYLPVDLRLALPEESTTGTGISQNLERSGEVNIDIKSDSLIIGWLQPFIDQNLINRLDGALETDIQIRGTGEDPELSGQGRLLNAVIRSPLVGVTFRDITSEIRLQDNIISFSNTSTRTGTGSFNVDGEIRLQDLASAEIDIQMQANEFNVINTREYRSTLSGDMNFTGTLTEPILTGDIELLNTDVFFDNAASQDMADLNVQLLEEDLRMLENQFGVRPTARDTATSDVYQALTIDIEIELGRDTWIRSRTNPEMNVQFDGTLDLTKIPFGEQEIFGSIEVNPDRSYITQFGKRFEINQGTITFNGSATDPILNFEARYEVPSRRGQENAVTVFMDIEGTLETLELTLRSEPTMELTDMVSYVVTGQPASEALQLGGLGNQSAESIAVSSGVGLLSNAIESLVQESGLELDVIQIEPMDNARGATITAGKYVTPRIFTAVSQPIGAADADGSTNEQGTVVTLELELLDSLLLRLLGGESVMEINLLWHYAY